MINKFFKPHKTIIVDKKIFQDNFIFDAKDALNILLKEGAFVKEENGKIIIDSERTMTNYVRLCCIIRSELILQDRKIQDLEEKLQYISKKFDCLKEFINE